MSFCKQEGKDQIIFVTEEDQSTPSKVVFEEPPDEPVGPLGKDGEINWSCPCLGNMATGPCGIEFRESFSCYQNSTEEMKGSDCVDQFRKMTECFAEYPEVYYSRDELGDPEEESKKEEQTSTEVAVSSEKEKSDS